jgi:hypothetical protein
VPTIKAGGKIQIHDASGAVVDGVTSNPTSGLYFADLVTRSSGGQSFQSEVLDVVFNTVVFHPMSKGASSAPRKCSIPPGRYGQARRLSRDREDE